MKNLIFMCLFLFVIGCAFSFEVPVKQHTNSGCVVYINSFGNLIKNDIVVGHNVTTYWVLNKFHNCDLLWQTKRDDLVLEGKILTRNVQDFQITYNDHIVWTNRFTQIGKDYSTFGNNLSYYEISYKGHEYVYWVDKFNRFYNENRLVSNNVKEFHVLIWSYVEDVVWLDRFNNLYVDQKLLDRNIQSYWVDYKGISWKDTFGNTKEYFYNY